MIRGVTGFPRNGKTMFVVMKIVDELVFSERHVAVNMDSEMKLGRLNEYIHEVAEKRHPGKCIDLDSRLTIIPKEHTFQFYRYRSGGLVLPEPPDTKMPLQEWFAAMKQYFLPMLEKPEWSVPVSYFIVEAHDFFPAKDWQDIGRPTKFYASKHAHLHDEVILETQFPEQMEPNFRRLIQEWHRMTNNYLLSFGPFKRKPGFKREVFLVVPPSTGGNPIETVEFKMDEKGIGSCYETTGSLGILGRGAESKGFNYVKKLPWWTLWAGATVAVLLLFGVMMMVPRLIGRGLGAMVSGTTSGMKQGLGTGVETIKNKVVKPAQPAGTTPPASEAVWSYTDGGGEDAREVVGYAIDARGEPVVWLTTGEQLGAADLSEVRRDGVVLKDKTVLKFKRRTAAIAAIAPRQ